MTALRVFMPFLVFMTARHDGVLYVDRLYRMVFKPYLDRIGKILPEP